MIEELKNNIDEEINILREISAFIGRRDGSTVPGEKKMLNDAVLS